MWRRILEAIGEEETIPQAEKHLLPSERYLYAMDTVALVQTVPDGKLQVKVRKPEWAKLIPPLLEAAEPYRDEICRKVWIRESQGICMLCSLWTPLNEDGDFGVCRLLPGITGRLFGCPSFTPTHRTCGECRYFQPAGSDKTYGNCGLRPSVKVWVSSKACAKFAARGVRR